MGACQVEDNRQEQSRMVLQYCNNTVCSYKLWENYHQTLLVSILSLLRPRYCLGSMHIGSHIETILVTFGLVFCDSPMASPFPAQQEQH